MKTKSSLPCRPNKPGYLGGQSSEPLFWATAVAILNGSAAVRRPTTLASILVAASRATQHNMFTKSTTKNYGNFVNIVSKDRSDQAKVESHGHDRA